jgi:hypothetical protein
MMGGPGMQQRNKGPRCKTAATSEEGEDIQQDLQEDRRAGDRLSCGKCDNDRINTLNTYVYNG